MMIDCFHCGQAVDQHRALSIVIDDEPRCMCCAGCLSVAKTISDASLTQYYRLRDNILKQRARLAERSDFSLFDDPAFQTGFMMTDRQGYAEANFIVSPIDCPACVWLIEKQLMKMKGIRKCTIDYLSGRLHLLWEDITLSAIAKSLASIGYTLTPEKPNDAIIQSKNSLKRATFGLFVGILCAMQTMMFALPIYLDTDWVMQSETRLFFEAATLCFALLAILIVGKDWIISALSDIRSGVLSMNLSLSLAILLLLMASMFNFFNKTGNLYFDSVTMLIAFVALSQWIQARINHQIESLRATVMVQTLPLCLRYIGHDDTTEYVTLPDIQAGDRLNIEPFDSLMVDVKLLSAHASLDEKMRTGENLPVHKQSGDILLAGARNLGEAIDVEVIRPVDQSWMGHVQQMLLGMSDQKPDIIHKTQSIAKWLLPLLLLATGMTYAGWVLAGDSHQAWLSALAVFVVVCPCALALSVPLALSATQTALLTQGIIINQASALETLPSITDIAFDKTGTLTTGELILNTWVNFSHYPDMLLLALAARLNSNSLHPVARAFYNAGSGHEGSVCLDQIINRLGKGIEAVWHVDKQSITVRLGALDFVAPDTDCRQAPDHRNDYTVYLGNHEEVLAVFHFDDPLREGCHQMLLDNQDKHYHILSGDHQHTVDMVADALGIVDRQARLLPEDKLHIIQSWQKAGKKVMMVGDGLNDSLVMAAADVSVSFSDAANLTKNQVDILFLKDSLSLMTRLITQATQTFDIIYQNVGWAILYHVLMLPLAVLGYVTPWLAGIGMAVSSMIVCLNSAKLLKGNQWKP